MTEKKQPVTIRGLLNELLWTGQASVTDVTYIDRGSTGDETTIALEGVKELGTLFMFLDEGVMIPYHRVKKIDVGGETVFRR